MKQIYIIHGWSGSPNERWMSWLKMKLEAKGFSVVAPQMPNADNPKIDEWVSYLQNLIPAPDKNTYFVGHSIGCQAIMRYVERLSEGTSIGGLIFVAGWFNLPNIETEEEKVIARPWLEESINTEVIKEKVDNAVAIFSDNDSDVPLSDKNIFEGKLGAKIIIEHEKGHFTEEDSVVEMPSVLEALLEMTK